MLKKFIDFFSKNKKYENFVINNQAVIIALDAETNRRKGNLKDAMDLINRAIQLEPDNDMYYVTKSLIFFDSGEIKDALSEINKALKLNNKVLRYKNLKKEILSKLR